MEQKLQDFSYEPVSVASDENAPEKIPEIDIQYLLSDEFLNYYLFQPGKEEGTLQEYNLDADRFMEMFLQYTYEVTNLFLIYENFTNDFMGLAASHMADMDAGTVKIGDKSLATVKWYIEIIYVKLVKALYSLHMNEYRNTRKHYDGLAKVTLIGIDKSLIAWNNLQNIHPVLNKEISHLMIMLWQLKRDVDRKFKGAKTFLRPGFDR